MNDELRNLSGVFKKYNLGCGTMLYKEYLNVGYWEQLADGVVYKDVNGNTGTFMLNLDLRHGIPAHDGSLDLIYHSHMLEHLSYEDGIAFLKDCNRALTPGGKLRLLVPDLEAFSKAYVANDRFFFEEYRKVLNADLYVTNAAIFMGMLHNHGHKCGYDFETIKWVLEHAGFTTVKKTLYSSSEYIDNIAEIEPHNPLRVMESLCVECVKPEVVA